MKKVALLCLVSLPVFADSAPSPTALQTFLGQLTSALIPLLGAALFGLIIQGFRWLGSKAKGTKLEHVVEVIEQGAEGVANRIETVLLPALVKATDASSPGGIAITAEERAEIIAKGVAMLKNELPAGILKTAQATFGAGLDAVLAAKVTAAVAPPPKPQA